MNSVFPGGYSARLQGGLTLIEVVVAVAIMALIAVGAYQSFDVVTRSSEVLEEQLKRIERIDRTWLLLENDLRNALGHAKIRPFEGPIPAMAIDTGQEYWLSFLRGGKANPLDFPRTEVVRVGYRFEEEALWRDEWIDPANPDIDYARQQKLLTDIKEVSVRALSPQAKSFTEGPWFEAWPPQGVVEDLPMALEVTLVFDEDAELVRLFSLAPGK